MGSMFSRVGDAFLRMRSGLAALLLCSACAGAWAQAPGDQAQGQIKALYGGLVTLPEGTWTVVDNWRLESDPSWYLTLLHNNDPEAVVPFFLIRVNPQSARWVKTMCDEDPNKAWKLMQYAHDTRPSEVLNKCSRVIKMGNTFSEYVNWAAAGNDKWFQDTAQKIRDLNLSLDYEIVGTESQIASLNSFQIQLNSFIKVSQLGVTQGEIQSARSRNAEHPVIGTLRTWLDDLVDANALSFLDSKPAHVASLNRSISSDATTSDTRVRRPDVSWIASDASILKIDDLLASEGNSGIPFFDYRDIYSAEVDLLQGNYRRALPYIKSTAMRGDVYGIGLLGLAFAEAKGVEADDAQALKLHSLAADFGDARSKEWLAQREMQFENDRIRAAREKKREAQLALEEVRRKEDARLLAARQASEQQRLAEIARQQEQQRLAELARQQALSLAAQKRPPPAVDREVYANRKALVIGNDAYKSVTRLLNAREDAKAMAAGLARVGYQVTLKTDLDMQGMKAAIRTFKSQIEGGDEVAIFYAGHGVQLANTNFLLPVDISGESEDQIKDDAIPLQRLLDDIADKRAKFTLAMIDACRDNPFKTANGRSMGASRGLSPTTAATGQMIVFSAGTGQQALDKLGPDDKDKNGVFTRVFLRQIDTPGVSVDRLVRSVRNEVVGLAKSVGHDQVPAIYDQVVGEFYFRK